MPTVFVRDDKKESSRSFNDGQKNPKNKNFPAY